MRFKWKSLLVFVLCIAVLFVYRALDNNKNIQIKNSRLFGGKQKFSIDVLNGKHSHDILVFVHIQKTGGSDFDRNIVRHLLVRQQQNATTTTWKKACQLKFKSTHQRNRAGQPKFRKYLCQNHSERKEEENKIGPPLGWYFSRQTFGWTCGLHPYYDELRTCVPRFYEKEKAKRKKNLKFFTILRRPVQRYVSEWQHVRRGATWKQRDDDKRQICPKTGIETCLNNNSNNNSNNSNNNNNNLTLEAFLACKHNLANNRQTRMLASFTSDFDFDADDDEDDNDDDSDYSDQEKEKQKLTCRTAQSRDLGGEFLVRAKRTLDSMPFFALNEYQHLSQLLFEKTMMMSSPHHRNRKSNYSFKVKFDRPLGQQPDTVAASIVDESLNKKQIEQIKKKNGLDIRLYKYAKRLFFQRLKLFKIEDESTATPIASSL